ncbi:transposase [Dyadobacter endophyticus]|uniref:transposase n=1 Tax=Dyadobacter endophyticus TaxID=1749036 RepID=UPI003CEE9D37
MIAGPRVRAFKKRQKYRSIMVDLHTGKIIDLLPDREEDSLRDWLQVRPEIKIVTRDRYRKYHRAITSGAPQAQQPGGRSRNRSLASVKKPW